eukprot:9278408-Pyramimonas_sp.AAC.1
MADVKQEPNIITYDALSSACEKSRRWQWQQAVALLSETADVKLEPNTITYGTLNSACEKST